MVLSCLPVDGLPILEVAKKVDPDERVASDEDEHAHDDEEALVDGHSHRLDEHGQGRVLPCNSIKLKDQYNLQSNQVK